MHKSKYNSRLVNFKKKEILKKINILILTKNKKIKSNNHFENGCKAK